MSKHYRFRHPCGHIGIGPLIRASELSFSIDYEPATSPQDVQSINLSLSIRCPFCADTQPHLNVAAGDGLLAVLEPSLTFPYSLPAVSNFNTLTSNHGLEWRVLRACAAHEISSADWSLAHAPSQRYRQMAWIPRPCGTMRLGRSNDDEASSSIDFGEVYCSWTQNWKMGQGVTSRLPGIWSSLKASMVQMNEDDDIRR